MTTQNLPKFRNKLMWLKAYIQRSLTYMTLLSSGMILFLFMSKLKESGIINIDLKYLFIPTFIITLILLVLVGWFEIRFLKGQQEEATINFNLSPPFSEMKNKIDKMYELQMYDYQMRTAGKWT